MCMVGDSTQAAALMPGPVAPPPQRTALFAINPGAPALPPHPTPVRTESVVSFLSPPGELERLLTPESTYEWLLLSSKCQADALVSRCVDHLVAQRTPLKADQLAVLQPAHIDRLLATYASALKAMDEVMQAQFAMIGTLRSSAAGVAQPLAGETCDKCRYAWFNKPTGKRALYCMNCGIGDRGKKRPRG
jgi:hypothetical protein